MTYPYRLEPFKHQVVGTDHIVKWDDPDTGRVYGGCFAIFDEMGAGKTKQTIDAAQILFTEGKISKVVVICPAAVRSVWFGPEFGELVKHGWRAVSNQVTEYHQKIRTWTSPGNGSVGVTDGRSPLKWFITNYDFIRKERLIPILDICDEQTLLVLDESSAVKSHKAKQSKACQKLRQACGRVLLLNGTPIANNPGDMYMQGRIMDHRILGVHSWIQFRARYAILGGFQNKQIVGWRHPFSHQYPGCCSEDQQSSVHCAPGDGLEDLQKRFEPYVIRRLKKDCLDLPKKLPPVTITVPLDQKTWEVYKKMRDELIAWLDEASVSMAQQAVVKALRLAQLTSGFLGGVMEDGDTTVTYTKEVGREKLDLFYEWFREQLEADPTIKILVWCRFRAELKRLVEWLNLEKQSYEEYSVGVIAGSQKLEEREHALRLLDPATAPDGPVVVVGNPQAGGMGLNLAAAYVVVYMSNDFSLKTRLQSEDRVHRPGQVRPVSYYDIVATGPDGQKTSDSAVLKALRKKDDIAQWTMRTWIEALED